MFERRFKYQFFVSYTNHENEVRVIKPLFDEVGRALRTRLGYYPIFIDSWVLKGKYRNQTTVLTSELKSAIKAARSQSVFYPTNMHFHVGAKWNTFTLKQ